MPVAAMPNSGTPILGATSGVRNPPRSPFTVKNTPTMSSRFSDVVVEEEFTLGKSGTESFEGLLLGAGGAVDEDLCLQNTPQPMISPGLKAHRSLSTFGGAPPATRGRPVPAVAFSGADASISVSPSSHSSSTERETSETAF